MPRVAIEDFNDDEIACLYLAPPFTEAQSVEVEFNRQNVDYAVEVESYLGSAVFWLSDYRGAPSTVQAAQAEFCCGIFRAAGVPAGLLEKSFQ